MTDGDAVAANDTVVVGVLALQGAFVEHVTLLQRAAVAIASTSITLPAPASASASAPVAGAVATTATPLRSPLCTHSFDFLLVKTPEQLARCCGLIIPGGESTAISLIAERTGLLEPLRQFVKVLRRPVWGTCAGLILLAETANKTKATGQQLIGGLDVRVHRNYFGRQVESFEADLCLPFLGGEDDASFPSVFIRAPVVEKVFSSAADAAVSTSSGDDAAAVEAASVAAPPRQHTNAQVEILGRLPGRARAIRNQSVTARDLGEDGDIVAVRQGNVFGTAFHPELTDDARIHAWWLREVLAWNSSHVTTPVVVSA